jgi:hypothetical protein
VFLLGREFLLRTDHSALRNLLRRDLPPTTRVERWILRLSEYTFKIEYKRGQDNIIADVLSRLPFAASQESGDSKVDAQVQSGHSGVPAQVPSLVEPSPDLRSAGRASTSSNSARVEVGETAASSVMQPPPPEGSCLPVGAKSDLASSSLMARPKRSLGAASFVLGELLDEGSDDDSLSSSSDIDSDSESSIEGEEECEDFEIESEIGVHHEPFAD